MSLPELNISMETPELEKLRDCLPFLKVAFYLLLTPFIAGLAGIYIGAILALFPTAFIILWIGWKAGATIFVYGSFMGMIGGIYFISLFYIFRKIHVLIVMIGFIFFASILGSPNPESFIRHSIFYLSPLIYNSFWAFWLIIFPLSQILAFFWRRLFSKLGVNHVMELPLPKSELTEFYFVMDSYWNKMQKLANALYLKYRTPIGKIFVPSLIGLYILTYGFWLLSGLYLLNILRFAVVDLQIIILKRLIGNQNLQDCDKRKKVTTYR